MSIDNGDFRNNIERFKSELKRDSRILNVSAMSGEPGGFHDHYAYKIADHGGEYVRMRSLFCDIDYIKTLGIKIVAGRDFSENFVTDMDHSIILNETAVKRLGWTPHEAIGKLININFVDSTYRQVIGIVQDYNFTSLKNEIEPLAIATREDYRKAAIKIKGNDVEAALETISTVYASIAPGYPFKYEFLDERFDNLYKSEKDTQILFSNFSIIAIVIACLGLFGLTMFNAELRRKEIGIRKVLGASVNAIVALITREFLVLVLISNVIAWPLSYYFMSTWIEDFAYRIEINLWMFFLAGGIVAFIAVLTLSYQAIKAAVANPVESLRYE
jgi:putative ABC transport system permease protein